MLNAIVIGDLHLNRLDKIFPNGTSLQLQHVEKIFEYGISKGVKTYIFTGDISHYSRLSEEGSHGLYQLVVKYERLGCTAHFIPGNHDHKKLGKNSLRFFQLLSKHSSIRSKFYEEVTTTTLGGCKVVFLPYPYTSTEECDAIVVGHFALKGALLDNNYRVPGSHKKDSNYYILGHLHNYQVGINYLYVGTPYQTKWAESLDRGFVWIKADGVNVRHKRITLKPTFELRTAVYGDEIVNSDTVRYKLSMSNRDDVPANFLTDNPSVHSPYTSPTAQVLGDVSYTIGLKQFLKDRGLSAQELSTAKEYVRQALQETELL